MLLNDDDSFTLLSSVATSTSTASSSTDRTVSVGHAVRFLAATVKRNWGKPLPTGTNPRATFLEIVNSLRSDLNFQQDSMQTASMRLLRGLDILTNHPTDASGWEDLQKALDSVDLYLPRATKSPEEVILCFQIMTACFLVLRQPTAAIASIQTQWEGLMRHSRVAASWRRFAGCLMGDNKKMALCREDKALMDLLYSRICAAVAICEQLDGYTGDHQRAFQRSCLGPTNNGDMDQDFAAAVQVWRNWDTLRVFKMAKAETVAVAAVPAAVTMALDPLVAVVAAAGSVPILMGNVPFLSKPLSDFDREPNVYSLRLQIMRICSGEASFPSCGATDRAESITSQAHDEEEYEIEFHS